MDYYSSTVEYDHPYPRSFEESRFFDHETPAFITRTLMWAICIICLPLNGAVVFATFTQLCSLMALLTIGYGSFVSSYVYLSGLMVSVGFRMCIALERCSVVFCPRRSCFRQSVIVCAVVCSLVWLLSLCFFISFTVLGPVVPLLNALAIFILLPCPFLIATLVVSLRSLCAADSVSPGVKHRVVGSVVLLLLVHMLLTLPLAVSVLSGGTGSHMLDYVLHVTLRLGPLADMFLYFFLTKRATE